MIDANKRLFERLEKFCTNRGVPIGTISGYRYIEGDDENDIIIQRLEVTSTIEFGSQRAAAHVALGDDDYIALIGFEYLEAYVNSYPEFGADVEQVECLPGHVVVLLSEIEVRPTRTGQEVGAFVEVAHSDTHGYEGHDVIELTRLFPRVSLFRCRSPLDESSFSQMVTKFSAAESAFGGGWISEPLLLDLLALASLSARTFPYEAVSRAVFDTDPRNMYLALYRCLEATYAYKTSEELARSLGLSMPWSDLAVQLDQKLSWRPRESSSLEVVLRYASDSDLRKVLSSLGKTDGGDPVSAAASSIYKLRNRIVHFGPARDSVAVSSLDWNVICCALIGVVYDVFHRAFDSTVA